jgi:hypothetical protein
MKTRLILTTFALLWLSAVGLGLRSMLAYENAPGVAATPAGQWPHGSRIQRASQQATLVLLAHPQCPCTRASISELALLMTHCQGKVAAHVLFFKPQDAAEDWAKTALWRSAAAIPGVQVSSDEGGLEARRFHAMTSGQTLLFDSAGHLRFSGGITGARGHAGDNAGRSAIESLLNTGVTTRSKSLVFGCSLATSQDTTSQEALSGQTYPCKNPTLCKTPR